MEPKSEPLRAFAQVVDALLAAAPWLTLGPYEDERRHSDDALDALDAVIAALTARAAMKGLVTAPSTTQAAAISTEGWIALPTCPTVTNCQRVALLTGWFVLACAAPATARQTVAARPAPTVGAKRGWCYEMSCGHYHFLKSE